jgi:hypothetical protein
LAGIAASQENVLKCGYLGDATKNSKANYACLTQGSVSCEVANMNGQPAKVCRWPNGGAVQYSTAVGVRPSFESVGRAPVDCTLDKAGAYGYGGTICTAR